VSRFSPNLRHSIGSGLGQRKRVCKEGGKLRSPGRRAIEAVDLDERKARRPMTRLCIARSIRILASQERISFVSPFFSDSVRIDKEYKEQLSDTR
jgi:hypothetical protein